MGRQHDADGLAGFSLVLLVWVLWATSWASGPGAPRGNGSFWSGLVGHPHPIVKATSVKANQAVSGAIPDPVHFPTSTARYFQFVFARITAAAVLGSVLRGALEVQGVAALRALWITFVYTVNAALPLGRRVLRPKGAVDYRVAT